MAKRALLDAMASALGGLVDGRYVELLDLCRRKGDKRRTWGSLAFHSLQEVFEHGVTERIVSIEREDRPSLRSLVQCKRTDPERINLRRRNEFSTRSK